MSKFLAVIKALVSRLYTSIQNFSLFSVFRLLFEMESDSVDIEHAIFTNSKSDVGYKTAMLKKV